MTDLSNQRRGPINRMIRFCLEQKLVVVLVTAGVIFWGVLVAPFDWKLGGLPRSPVPVDAIPDIGENQQIVFTEWPGRSPQDIDDQISYPLTVALLGHPRRQGHPQLLGVRLLDDLRHLRGRRRLLLVALARPREAQLVARRARCRPDVTPALGPDATALGQVFWYTLEGRDRDGNPTGGWDLDELRSIQDFTVKYKLAGVEGVAEVASIGGFVREYQVDVNPDAMRAASVTLQQVIAAVRKSNLDVGARTLEVNRAEYIVRGLGFIKNVSDLEQTAIIARAGQPILIERHRDRLAGTRAAARRAHQGGRGSRRRRRGRAVRRESDGDDPAGPGERIEEIASGLPTQGARRRDGEPRDDRAVLRPDGAHQGDAADAELGHRAGGAT